MFNSFSAFFNPLGADGAAYGQIWPLGAKASFFWDTLYICSVFLCLHCRSLFCMLRNDTVPFAFLKFESKSAAVLSLYVIWCYVMASLQALVRHIAGDVKCVCLKKFCLYTRILKLILLVLANIYSSLPVQTWPKGSSNCSMTKKCTKTNTNTGAGKNFQE